ncbi:hypothetical protein TVAG_147380 [Trichomonas vaginalis G3]|uniref:Uncharacterized protein n=1 Tax=Trichomonas vaginalis (strain ATCC PRA-98 / G3) TaxID=412133 RepID=A2G7S2_TRIV3|nr:ankyrin repeat domain-containing protein 61 family [Trichomonas vaginalis G3]EAX86796.1 hypothetical protein TVAG_147380 [Trichomonas vaginalis G3]KAI5529375.1 ankyrin repeat domain-containing protein 61 family [Trichomonas vaginalis G3]|eukprot:XP_001299726.1 hypothetical protein [Trichomonas vaginalis G3]
MNFDFNPILKQIIHNSSFQRITIIINDHRYYSNIVFGSAFSNSINNQVKKDSTRYSFEFYCCIQNESTYDILELIFDGNFEGQNLNNVINDLFNVGVAMESNTLLTWYRSFYPLSIQNYKENAIYYKEVGNIDEFIDFTVRNFQDLGLQKVIDACLKIGIDFAELLANKLGDMKKEFIISLIEQDLQFSVLINQIDTEKLTYEDDIRLVCLHNNSIAHDYHPNNEFVHFFLNKFNEKILSDLRSKDDENKELTNHIIDTKDKLQQSQLENQKIKIEFENLKNENQKLKQELENAKKQLENPPPRVFSQSELELISIHKAASKNNIEIVKLLINNGVNVNEMNENGETPLHSAISANCFEVAEFLIKNGADVNKVNNSGNSPLQIAKGNAKMVDLLIRNGAKEEKVVTNYEECNSLVYQSTFDFNDYKEEPAQPEQQQPRKVGWLERIFGVPRPQNHNNIKEKEKPTETANFFDAERERNDFKEKHNETTNFFDAERERNDFKEKSDETTIFFEYVFHPSENDSEKEIKDESKTEEKDISYYHSSNYDNEAKEDVFDNEVKDDEIMIDNSDDNDKNEVEKSKDFYFYTDAKDDDDDQDASKYYIDDEEEDDDKYI